VRVDREEYTPDVNKVLGACAVGKGWDDLWGDCVNAWLDFEAACGYDNNGGQLTAESRPVEMTKFINTGSKWYVPPRIEEPGHREEEGTFAARWWAWWAAIQPKEGWGTLPKMHGRLGLMLVIGSLAWWGTTERGEDWEAVVSALTELFHGLVKSGELVDK
jgi:hypothetical protein